MVIKTVYTAWRIIAKNNLQNQLLTLSSSTLFIMGKFLNYIFTLVVIFAIFRQTPNINGYNLNQAVIFVLVYNLAESITQFLFRSIYSFRPVLVRGDFDLDLLKPLPSFFRPLLSGPDFLDLPLIIIQSLTLIYYLVRYNILLSYTSVLLFIVLLSLSVITAFFLFLAIAAFCILTTEIDNLVWLYRSLMRSSTIPTDVYHGVFRFILDFVVPVTIISTVPAKSLLGLLAPEITAYVIGYILIFCPLSWLFWKYSISTYTSAGG